MSAPPPNQEDRGRLLFAALFFPSLPAGLLLMTFIEPKGPPWLVEILPKEPPWLVWSVQVILAALLAGVCQFVSRPMLQEFRRKGRETPDAAPGAPLERETVTDLWVSVIVLSVFGGMFVSVPLAGTNTEGGAWGTFLAVLIAGGFFGTAATALSVPRLEELARRGKWVPPGTARHPVRVAVALALLIMVATAAAMLTVNWLLRLAGPAS